MCPRKGFIMNIKVLKQSIIFCVTFGVGVAAGHYLLSAQEKNMFILMICHDPELLEYSQHKPLTL